MLLPYILDAGRVFVCVLMCMTSEGHQFFLTYFMLSAVKWRHSVSVEKDPAALRKFDAFNQLIRFVRLHTIFALYNTYI